MTDSTKAYDSLCTLGREHAVLGTVSALLGWDQETGMPRKGAAARAEAQSLISRHLHVKATDPKIGDLLSACEDDKDLTGDPNSVTAANIREMRRDFDKRTKVPASLIAELARAGSQAQEAWKDARERNDFAGFAPMLERMIDLSRQKAECFGAPDGGEIYDALLDDYEPNTTSAEIEAVFAPLGKRLSTFIATLRDEGTPPDTSVLDTKIDADRQHAFGKTVLRTMGFDFDAGRLDVSVHPFCEGVGPGDTRMTTRYREERFTDALYGTMHEGGHGLYEQGLPKLGEESPFGTPGAEPISLGIHESQSRMWENSVGRSHAFWEWAMPHAKQAFGTPFKDATVEVMYNAVNTATPSLIRVEADEATYNLHVMLRFEIERSLIRGELAVRDLPGVWNENFKRLLGLDVPDDRRGCLQDVHWSFGLLGYFPTYTLGNLYAAQFWEKILQDMPDLDAQISAGKMIGLRDWLRTNIHQFGRRYSARDLCVRVTGKELSADPLMRHLENRLRPVYGLK